MTPTICSAENDTRFFEEALREYRIDTGERRPVDAMPPVAVSFVLRRAQQLKEKENSK